MTENMTFRDVVVKVLAITGFLVTVAVVVWGATLAVKQAPRVFSSLASIVESMQAYRPLHELTITTQKTVVNSAESFEILWTDVRQTGEYAFTYTCTEGIALQVRGENDSLMPMSCTDTLTLPATVHGLYLTIDSTTSRFTDVPLHVSFTNTDKSEAFENTVKITVVNAGIEIKEQTIPEMPEVIVIPPVQPTEEAVTETPAIDTPTTPVTITAPSQVSQQSDLAMTILGSGVIRNGVFSFTQRYDRDLNNALRFDVKNVGTAVSDTWYFNAVLPSGKVYTSPKQSALRPGDHIEFTLGFYLDGDSGAQATLTTMLYSTTDTNESNDSKSITVTVR